MIQIYVDMSNASEAERVALTPGSVAIGVKVALEAKAIRPVYSIVFTNEQVIATGRVLATTAGAAVGIAPSPAERVMVVAEDGPEKNKGSR